MFAFMHGCIDLWCILNYPALNSPVQVEEDSTQDPVLESNAVPRLKQSKKNLIIYLYFILIAQ